MKHLFRFQLLVPVCVACMAISTIGAGQQEKQPPAEQNQQPQAEPRRIKPGDQAVNPRQWPPQQGKAIQNNPPLRLVNRNRFNNPVPELHLDLERIKRAQIPQEIQRQVARLASDDFQEREDASRELRNSPLPDEVLIAVLERNILSAEQRNRMLRVVRWRVRDRPRGAVGIRMSTNRKGVVVTELVPDLPAERVLKVGDQIIRINDTEVRSNTDLVGVVQRLLPGTRITMTVLRPIPPQEGNPPPDEIPEERIEVEFPLGSYAKLDNEPDALGLTNPETERRNMMVRAIQKRYAVTAELLEGAIVTETETAADGK